LFWLFFACCWARRVEALVSRIDPQGRPRSGRRSLTPTPDGACCGRRRNGVLVLLLGAIRGGRVRGPVPVPAGGQAPVGLSVIPSPREVGGMECCDMVAVGGIKRDDHAAVGRGS
jgi:hypothetical protein